MTMPDVSVLEVLLYGEVIGTLTNVQGDRTLFAFSEHYISSNNRPTLSLSFKDKLGGLITDIPPTQTRVPTFFSNMLPESTLRDYLAKRAGVNPRREFFLLWILGKDLPGALTIRPADGEAWPPDDGNPSDEDEEEKDEKPRHALRFSLAGVQLKFSAAKEATGGLTIPAEGVGGSWIIKLPSTKFDLVPENEFSMMTLATRVGIEVPEIKLVDVQEIAGMPEDIGNLKGSALAVSRFDRTPDGPLHMEDFAQIFGVYPEDKYDKASMRNIAEVLAAEGGEEDIAELIRRLVFNAMIGNADMHLKNWSVIYRDRQNARLSPAYDFVSTVPYIEEAKAALTIGRYKDMAKFSRDELTYLAAKARLPEKLVVDTAIETVARFRDVWSSEKNHLPLSTDLIKKIDDHIQKVPIAQKH
jgi:serine/threonine-protein kinase HipA